MNIKKFIYVSIFSVLLFVPVFVHAQVKISEIMYDPDGSDTKREWIEVFNAGSESIDLSTYFLLESNVYHKLVANTTAILGANTYAIIVGSIPEVLADYPGFNGLIFDSVFSLNNTGETIALANSNKETIDTITYTSEMGANNDGQSLQITDGAIIHAGATFGLVNKTESEVVAEESSESGSSTEGSGSSTGSSITSPKDSSHTQQVAVSTHTPTIEFKAGAGRNRTISMHTPIQLEGTISKSEIRAKYEWNFGDFKTNRGQKVDHVYDYAGVYQVVLEAYSKEYTAVSRTEVVVVEPQLTLIEDAQSITITNNDSKEINLGGFELVFDTQNFFIPINSILKSKGSVRFNKPADSLVKEIRYPDGYLYQSFPSLGVIDEQMLFDLIQ